MATLEPNRKLSLHEYISRREERLHREQLIGEAVYCLYVRTDEGTLEAAKFAIKPEIAAFVGESVLRLSIMDDDLREATKQFSSQMNDGMLYPEKSILFNVTYKGQAMPAREGYILDYEYGLGMPNVQAAVEYKSPRELVGI